MGPGLQSTLLNTSGPKDKLKLGVPGLKSSGGLGGVPCLLQVRDAEDAEEGPTKIAFRKAE